MESNMIVKQEVLTVPVTTQTANGQSHSSGISAPAFLGQTVLVHRNNVTSGQTTTPSTVFVPRVGPVQIPNMSPRKVADSATPVRFVIAQTVGGGMPSSQLNVVGSQASIVGIGQQAVLVGSPSPFYAASPRKLVPVMPAGGLRPSVRSKFTAVGGRAGDSSPAVQQFTTALTRSPAKITVVSAPRTQSGSAQVITLVANNIATSPAIKSSALPPYKVVIRPSTGSSIQPVGVTSLSAGAQLQLAQFPAATTSSIPISVRPNAGFSNVHQLPVSGSKFQYVRLVAAPISQSIVQATPVAVQARMLSPPNTTGVGSGPALVAVAANDVSRLTDTTNAKQGYSSSMQPSKRLILPATTSSFVSTDTVRTSSDFNDAMSHMMKAAKEFQVSEQSNKLTAKSPMPMQPIVIKPEPGLLVEKMDTNTKPVVNGSSSIANEEPSQKPRKPCNCTKSQCLKLYCDCFANGEFCNGCNCCNCANNLDHEEDRLRAIRACLDRNPLAFHPKIGKGREGDTIARQHAKGCNCKRSGCLKNYCECYEAKILCSYMCKCYGCKNYEDSQQHKTLMHLADAAEVRVLQQVAANSKLSTPSVGRHAQRSTTTTSGKRLAYTFITSDVVEATCECLLATMEESAVSCQSDSEAERQVLEEFGQCLLKVIESSNGTSGS